MTSLVFLKSAKLFSLVGLILLTSRTPIDQGSSGKREKSSAPDRVNNIVLVHGAWADGSGWEGVSHAVYIRHAAEVAAIIEKAAMEASK
jgi:hypothetical protein